jgi:hypothetical protein
MHNFRQFELGPDPFGRKFQVLLKWLQTAISIRHSDSVDVKFILTGDTDERTEKTIALMHPDLLAVSKKTGRTLDDAWCARLAAAHLGHLVETGEDMEKDLVTVPLAALEHYAGQLAGAEKAAVRAAR